jgi:tetratricopeptide (TPR) repeat protein
MILTTLGNAYVQSRKYPDAVRVLEEALGLKPDDQQRAMILTTLGNAYVQSRKYPDAVRVLEEALELKPDDQSRAMILNTLGNAYTNNGNYSMAKPALTEALDISLAKKLIRSASTAYLFMAQMYERFGELKSAFDTYNKGAEWDEHHNNEQPATKKRAAAAKLKDKF